VSSAALFSYSHQVSSAARVSYFSCL